MKPVEIRGVLDLALKARENGDVFNPLFVGAPGLGKSEIVQKWAKDNELELRDLRIAYLEAPDLIGFPIVTTINGRQITEHATPDFWPKEGRGVLLLEEPNRGTTSVMNTLMQLLTDRKVHNYTLPEGWIIVGCINPENEAHDVNTMDAALKNRFEIFHVEYHKDTFIQYAKQAGYHKDIVHFVESDTWTYVLPEKITEEQGGKYVSPRSFSKLNTALKVGFTTEDQELSVYQSVLGMKVSRAFFQFRKSDKPVTFYDLLRNKRAALAKLEGYSDPNNYRSSYLRIFADSLLENVSEEAKGSLTQDLLTEVLLSIPPEFAYSILKELEFKTKDEEFTKQILQNKTVRKYLKDHLS